MASKSIEQVRQEKFDELESLRLQQASGETIKIPANKNDKYEINEHDKNMVHFRRVLKMNNPSLMTYESYEDIQQFHPNFFEANKNAMGAGYSETEVIHYPVVEGKSNKQAGDAFSKIAKKDTNENK